jgi:exopolyphosphatase/pppGpp-phosphohydrolase
VLFRSLFDAAIPDADAETRRELGWACALHELGLMVSHHDHHRHSAYLLAHVDAPGFSQSQQRRVAELVLGHRGSLRKLDPAAQAAVVDADSAMALLREQASIIKRPVVAWPDGRVTVGFDPADWAARLG